MEDIPAMPNGESFLVCPEQRCWRSGDTVHEVITMSLQHVNFGSVRKGEDPVCYPPGSEAS